MKKYALITALLLTACSTNHVNYQAYLNKKGLSEPKDLQLQHCRGYGCQHIDDVELSKQDWKTITKPFRKKAKTPKSEREKIALSIAEFEKIVGAKTGSDVDVHGTFRKTGTYQLDCVDESTNTTVYMLALKNHGLITHHDIEAPTARFPIIHSGRWPHQAALIKEKQTEEYYVVDSWFHDNGAAAEVIPLKQWKDGWKPDEYR